MFLECNSNTLLYLLLVDSGLCYMRYIVFRWQRWGMLCQQHSRYNLSALFLFGIFPVCNPNTLLYLGFVEYGLCYIRYTRFRWQRWGMLCQQHSRYNLSYLFLFGICLVCNPNTLLYLGSVAIDLCYMRYIPYHWQRWVMLCQQHSRYNLSALFLFDIFPVYTPNMPSFLGLLGIDLCDRLCNRSIDPCLWNISPHHIQCNLFVQFRFDICLVCNSNMPLCLFHFDIYLCHRFYIFVLPHMLKKLYQFRNLYIVVFQFLFDISQVYNPNML